MGAEDINYEELIEVYSDPTKSLHDLADYFKCGYSTIRRFMIDLEIPIRKYPKKLNLDKETVRKLYWDDNISPEEIGEMFNCHPVTIYKFMRESNIPRKLKR